jgi:hypothetical protein
MLVIVSALLMVLGMSAASARRAWTVVLVRIRDVMRALGAPLAALHGRASEDLAKVRQAHDRERPLNPLPVMLMAALCGVFIAMEFAGVAIAYPALVPSSSATPSAVISFVDRYLEPLVALSIVLPLVVCGSLLAQCYSKRPVLPVEDFTASSVRRVLYSGLLACAVGSSLWVATSVLSTVRARSLVPESNPPKESVAAISPDSAPRVSAVGSDDLMGDADQAAIGSSIMQASVLSQHEAWVMFSLMALSCLIAAFFTYETGVLPMLSGGGAVMWLVTVAPLALLLAFAALLERAIEVTEALGHSLIGACERVAMFTLRPVVTFARDRYRWTIGADGARQPSVTQAVSAAAFDVQFPDVDPQHREAGAPTVTHEPAVPSEPVDPGTAAGDPVPTPDDSDPPPSPVSNWEGAFPARPRTKTL